MTVSPLKELPLPPGRSGWPWIGETLGFLSDPQFSQKRYRQYGPVFRTVLFGKPTIYFCGAEANRFVFSHENQYFVATWPPTTRTLLGETSLAVQTGSGHQQRRKLLAQAFQPRALATYVPLMVEITEKYLNKWAQTGTLTWYPELRNYTFDIACQLLTGIPSGSQSALGEAFETWGAGLFSLPINLPWTRFGKALASRQQILDQIEQIVRDRQANPSETAQDSLELLLHAQDEDGSQLTLTELKDQVLLLLFAGHETLTSAIASFCLLIAQHPQVLEDLRAEQEHLGVAPPWNLEQLKSMTYLDQVLKEVLRFTPPVGGGFRRVIQTCEFNGYQIPEGWTALYQIKQTHQDQTVYQTPEAFDPGRFSRDRAEDKPQPFSYVPFGGGLRECLGREFARLEMKLFATLLVRHYDWQLLPNQNLDLVTIPTPHPRDGLKVQIKPRV